MANPASPINPRSKPARARRIISVFGGGFGVIVAILLAFGPRPARTQLAPPSQSLPVPWDSYVGPRRCAECHPGEFAAYSGSGHARTLRPAARTPQAARLAGSTFGDPERSGVTWQYTLHDGQFMTERHEGEKVERFVIDYAFGSGHHATTFVSLTNRDPDHPTILEHRLTAYTHKEAPDITPGQNETSPNKQGTGPSGRHYDTAGALKCFECHTTVMSKRGPLVLDTTAMIPNVGCERCHGPGRQHVEAAARHADSAALAMPFGAGHSTPAEEMRMCGSCHRLPGMGDRALVRRDNPVLVRFQPVGLMQSTCYRKSPGTLSCTTCHDPHARTSTDAPAYEAVCLSCHQGPDRTPCPVAPATGCVGCHMPKRDVFRGMTMTDHWIR